MDPLEWKDGKLKFLDQTKLPFEEAYYLANNVETIAVAIEKLAIRGAPLIGIAGAYGVAVASFDIASRESNVIRKNLETAITRLASTRPTAVNLFRALERQRKIINQWQSNSLVDLQNSLIDEAIKIHSEEIESCERISSYGSELLPSSCSVLTHCNTGILATGGKGTALGIIRKSWELKKLNHVYIGETRPLLQGSRLTAWELKKDGIPATLITDSTTAYLMKKVKIDAVIVGADRIAINGDVANKIGTYNLAVLAKHHNIPFYVAAPVSTIDFGIKSGNEIQIEERNKKEVLEVNGMQIAPEETDVYAPAFDVTPYELITAIVTNQKVLYPPFVDSIKLLEHGISIS